MRRDLLQWEAALQLSRVLAPGEIPFISREYALEMECVGDYVNALMHFESALSRNLTDFHGDQGGDDGWLLDEFDASVLGPEQSCSDSTPVESEEWTEHVRLCNAGVARNAIRLGDNKRSVSVSMLLPIHGTPCLLQLLKLTALIWIELRCIRFDWRLFGRRLSGSAEYGCL